MPQEGTNPGQGRMPKYRGKTGLFGRLRSNFLRYEPFLISEDETMIQRFTVKPALLQWACERAQVDPEVLNRRFPKYSEWKRGTQKPTLRQVKDFAQFTHVPIMALFLSKPLEEKMPIQDFRTVGNEQISQPSANLLDTIYTCQQRQEWYQRYALAEGHHPLPFVGSATLESDIELTANDIRIHLGFDSEKHKKLPNWTHMLRYFTDLADTAGILVMTSSVVENNPHRKLDPQEFRGFALADRIAPLIFINGADTKAAQIFTLAHELAHIWLGESGVSIVSPDFFPSHSKEHWCNQVAAELLVPISSLHDNFRAHADLSGELQRLARQYKVSTLVILRRLYDMEAISKNMFAKNYQHQLKRLKPRRGGGGGNFYATLRARVGYRFAAAIIDSALSGQTSYTGALNHLGIKKLSTLDTFADSLQEK